MDAKLNSFGADRISPTLPSSAMKKCANMDGGFFPKAQRERKKYIYTFNTYIYICSHVHLQWSAESGTHFANIGCFLSACIYITKYTE